MLSAISDKNIRDSNKEVAESILRFCGSITSALHWIYIDNDVIKHKNASAFFLNTGERLFGVTASHVIDKLQDDVKKYEIIAIQLSSGLENGQALPIDINFKNQVIDCDKDIDIATFQITQEEVDFIGKQILSGNQNEWPPKPPEENRGIFFCGFPEITTAVVPFEYSFGLVTMAGTATSINSHSISAQIEREEIIGIPTLGGQLPENFDFSGFSGGPMVTLVEHKGLVSWRFGGVIYEGPRTSGDENDYLPHFEVIKARRADFICANGTLNKNLASVIFS